MSSHPARHLRLIAFAAIALTTSLTGAETAPVALPTYEVVGTPIASVPVADTFAASSTVLSAQQLREMEPLDFASALRRTPGVTISRFNQVGAFGGTEGGAVFLRGLGTSRPGGEIKILQDGVPKMNGIFNHPLLDLLSIDSAARISVHGRATPLEFGNTFAAISVTTPRVETSAPLARASLAAGSFGTFVERLDAGERRGNFDYYVSQSLRQSDGHRDDADGRMENYLVRLGWSLSPQFDLSYVVNRTNNRASDPGVAGARPGPPSTRGEHYLTDDWFHVATLAHHTATASGTLRAYLNDGDANWSRRPYSGNADTIAAWRLSGLRWREQVKPWAGGEIVGGADLDYDRGSLRNIPLAPAPVGAFGPTTLRIFSPYLGLSHVAQLANGLTLTPSLGVRTYSHSEFARQTAPQAGVTVTAGKTTWHAGASRAVNYPGLEVAVFSQVLIPALGQSWRKLNAEQADQFEAGVRHALNDRSSLSLTVFSNRVRDRYVIVFPPPPPPRYSNLGNYRTEGIELTADAAWSENLAVFAAASLVRTTPGDIPYAPETTLTTGVNWQPAKHWHVSTDAVYVSSMHIASEARVAATTNPLKVGANFLLTARLSRRFTWGARDAHRGEIYLSAENLTDREFAYQPGYPIPGLNFMIGVRLER